MSDNSIFELMLTNNYVEALELTNLTYAYISGVKVIEGLKEVSKEEWKLSEDAMSGKHLIGGVLTSGEKTTLVQAYVAKLTATFLNSEISPLLCRSKSTLLGSNFLAKHLTDKLSTTMFKDEGFLFNRVMVDILGFEESFIKAALASNLEERGDYIATSIVTRASGFEFNEALGEVDELTALIKRDENESLQAFTKHAKAIYPEFVDLVKELLSLKAINLRMVMLHVMNELSKVQTGKGETLPPNGVTLLTNALADALA